MARIRTIKPGFFKHAELFDAEKATGLPLRLAFAGLWTVADREGRFKWKPREIKTDVLPYDDLSMDDVLNALVTHRFIFRYKQAGEEYGYIPTFSEHQHVNKNEAPSTIPAPSKNSSSPSKNVRTPKPAIVAPSKHHEELVVRKGREGEDEDERAPEFLDRVGLLQARICEILEIRLEDDPSRVTWRRQIEAMIRDGIPELDIIKATDKARTNGRPNLSYIRAIALNPPKENHDARRESPQRQEARIAAELIAEFATRDGDRNLDPSRGPGSTTGLLEIGHDGRPEEGSLAPNVRRFGG